MLTKMRIGAVFALTAAAIIGCGSDKKTIVVGGSSGELNSTDSFPASSISQNNLAQDKGGFSENNQNFVDAKCKFNVKQPASDGAKNVADSSAMIAFATKDQVAPNAQRLYFSHWDGSTFTIPVEGTGVDREDTLPANDLAVHTDSIVLIPLNTSGYKSPGSTTGPSDQLVRANSGNWLILWDSQTHTVAPASARADLTGAAAADVNGTHHTVYATMFLKNLRSQPVATTNLIGNTATSGTANGPATTTRYGFQVTATEITSFRGGASVDFTNGALGGNPGNGGFNYRPAEDIISYGAATDTFVGCASFSANGTGNPTGLVPDGQAGSLGALVTGPTRINTAGNITAGAGVRPATADYTVGDDTTFVQLFWVQLITSHVGGNSLTLGPSNANATLQFGPAYRMVTANFNLASMTVTNQKLVPFVANRNGAQGNPTGQAAPSAQPMPNFATYNNMVFWNYRDASLLNRGAGNAGQFEATASDVDVSQALAVLRVAPAANGTADIDATTQFDATRTGSAGKHVTTLSQNVGTAGRSVVTSEFVGLVDCSGVCRSDRSAGSLFGNDEGLGDVTAFVTVRNTSNLSANDTDVDTQVGVLAVNPTTGVAVTGAQTGNIRRLSVHATEPFTSSIGTNLRDSAFDIKTSINRDGTAILVGWRQAIGTSINATVDLHATVYKTFRQASSTASVGSAIIVTPTTLDQRVPATNPVRVSTGTALTYTNVANLGLQGAPVAAWDWQGGVGYRCGFQSDVTKTTAFYAYSDGSGDRLFARQLQVTLGTAAATPPTLATGTEVQFETGNLAPSNSAPLNNSRSSFEFIPGQFGLTAVTYAAANGVTAGNGCTTLRNLGTGTAVDSRDAGSSGAAGDVLVVFDKITDNTVTDGNYFDRKIVAARYTGTTVSDRATISRNVHENATDTTKLDTKLYQLISRTSTASLSKSALSADNGTYIYFTAPASDNASSPRGVYTRRFKPQATSTSATTFTQLFVPPVGTAGSTNTFGANGLTTDAGYKEPTRIDRLLNSDATPILYLFDGKTVTVFMTQDNHIWASTTSDGDSYSNTNGLSTPALVDNNFSTNTGNHAIKLDSCIKPDTDCDTLHGTVLVIQKNDVQDDTRAYIRVMQ